MILSSFAGRAPGKLSVPVLTIVSALVFSGSVQAQTGSSMSGMGHTGSMGGMGGSMGSMSMPQGAAPSDTGGASWMGIHPQKMTLGTTNPAAGEHPIGTDGNAIVSVSPQCAGNHRCPLFIFLPGAGIQAREITDWLRPVADKYGMLVMAITDYDPSQLKPALEATLKDFAVDTARIAIIGRCASGGAGMRFGIDNPDVFSRIALISGPATPSGTETAAQKNVPVLIDGGILEAGGDFATAKQWQADGHPVTLLIGLRGHEHQVEDYDFLGKWLTDSWAQPDPAKRKPPEVVADPLPVLTTDAMAKLTKFWTLFSHEPDSVLNTARRANLHEVVVPVGTERPSLYLVDMSALAAHVPSVAADLKQAGLTAQDHDAYRAALISARIAMVVRGDGGDKMLGDLTTSVLGKNIAFAESHPDEIKALTHAGMEHADRLEDPELGGDAGLPPGMVLPPGFAPGSFSVSYPRPNPAMVKDYGPMGIWRTP